MYSIDGVPLQNPGLGWRFKRGSEPWVSRSFNRADFNAANRDGTVSVRGNIATPTLTLVVQAPGTSIEALRRLLRLGSSLTLTSDGSAALTVEAMTVTHRTVTPAGGGLYEVTVVYRCPEVWWRDVSTTDWSATIPTNGSAGAASLSVLTKSTAPVHDALVVVQGGIVNARLAGQGGSWLQYSESIYGQWVRMDTTRGRCWFGVVGSTDPWADTSSEATAHLDTGAYPYFLELVPASTGAPGAALTVSFDKVTQPTTVTVRARNAYDR